MRELGWRAAAARTSGPRRAALARRWGCSSANRLADGAGWYRRIAAGLAAVPGPLAVVAVALVGDGRASAGFAGAHLVVAGGCAWLAVDLCRSGSALTGNGLPHLSSIALLAGIGLLVVLAPVEPAVGFGPPLPLATGLAALVGGYLVLMAAERNRDRFLVLVGRSAVVTGAVLVGTWELGRAASAHPLAPLLAVGLGAVAVALLAMAWCEARVLLRGAALYRTLVRR